MQLSAEHRRTALLAAGVVVAGLGLLLLVGGGRDVPDRPGDAAGGPDRVDAPIGSGPGGPGVARAAVPSVDEVRRSLPPLAPGRISGIVRDEGGRPLAGARIRVLAAPPGGPKPSVRTGADGLWSLDGLAAGLHALRAEATARIGLEIGGIAAGTRGLDLVLRAGWSVRLRLRRVDDGHPIESATVEATTGEWSGRATWAEESRSYHLDGVPAGPIRLVAIAPGLVPAFVDRFVAAGGPTEIDLDLESGRTIDGRITAAGRPVDGARVTIWNLDHGRAAAGRTTSDAGGTFEMGGLVPGPIGVVVEARGHSIYDSERAGAIHLVGTTEAVHLEIELPKGLVLAGRVVWPDGRGVGGARVAAREAAGEALARTTTDRDGRFLLEGVPTARGLYLHAEADGRSPARSAALATKPDVDPAPIELVLGTGVRIGGRLTGPDGRPVVAARVVVDLTDGWLGEVRPSGLEVQSDAGGTYGFPPLPAGTYPILFEHPDHRPSARTIEIPAGASFEHLPVDVTLAAGESLTGRVIDAAGRGVAGATLVAHQVVPGAIEAPLATTFSGFDGSFAFANLAPGPIHLRAFSPGHVPAEIGPVAAGSADVVVSVLRRYLVAGRVLAPPLPEPDDDGGEEPGGHRHAHGLGRFTVRLRPLDATGPEPGEVAESFDGDPEPRFVLDGLPEGRYVLEVHATGYRVAVLEGFDPAEWTGRELVVALEPGPVFAGRVLGPDDRPVAGAFLVRGGDLSRFDPFDPESHARVLGSTDHEGRYRVTGLDAGETFSIVEDDHAPLAVRAGASDVHRLPPAATVRGVVLGVDRQAAAGVEVVAEGPILKVATTDDGGRFELGGLAAGRYRILRTDRPPDQAGLDVDVPLGATVEVVLD